MKSLLKRYSLTKSIGQVRRSGPQAAQIQTKQAQPTGYDYEFDELLYALERYYDLYDPEGLDDGTINLDAIAAWTLRQETGLQALNEELKARFTVDVSEFLDNEAKGTHRRPSFTSYEKLENGEYGAEDDYYLEDQRNADADSYGLQSNTDYTPSEDGSIGSEDDASVDSEQSLPPPPPPFTDDEGHSPERVEEIRELLERFFLKYDPEGLSYELEGMMELYEEEDENTLNAELYELYGKTLTMMLDEESASRVQLDDVPRKKSVAERFGVPLHNKEILTQVATGARRRLTHTEVNDQPKRRESNVHTSLERQWQQRASVQRSRQDSDEQQSYQEQDERASVRRTPDKKPVSRTKKPEMPKAPEVLKRSERSDKNDRKTFSKKPSTGLDLDQFRRPGKNARQSKKGRHDRARRRSGERVEKRDDKMKMKSKTTSKYNPQSPDRKTQNTIGGVAGLDLNKPLNKVAPVATIARDDGSGACNSYVLDLTGAEFGACRNCGKSKMSHFERSRPVLSTTLERRWKRGNLPKK